MPARVSESVTAAPLGDRSELSGHQDLCGENSFPPRGRQVKPLSLPTVRPQESHISFWLSAQFS